MTGGASAGKGPRGERRRSRRLIGWIITMTILAVLAHLAFLLWSFTHMP
ncbi:MAG: hypothetical protein H6807_10555 [Planctomycetes bacterium]|nr:hypothetical protein [Planctomycetota bacterium]